MPDTVELYKEAFGTIITKVHVTDDQDTTITTKDGAVDHFRPLLSDEAQEKLMAAYLTSDNTVIGTQTVTKGTLRSTSIDIQTIIRTAAITGTSAVILAHNHPGGDADPTTADKHATEKVQRMLEHLEINLLDHIILTDTDATSFKQEDLLVNPTA